MTDQNDIIFNQNSLDLFGFLEVSLGSLGKRLGGVDAAETVVSVVNFISTSWTVFTVLSILASLILIFGLIYAYIRGEHLEEAMHEELVHREGLYAELYGKRSDNKRWEDVQKHILSDSPNDWRLSIIEADIMLEELLEATGFAGGTIGEKLKSASPTQFKTLEQAWRAHKVRNQIAHAGQDFVLTKKVASETITQYKMVFADFELI